jgi:DNA-binding protein HU-beta
LQLRAVELIIAAATRVGRAVRRAQGLGGRAIQQIGLAGGRPDSPSQATQLGRGGNAAANPDPAESASVRAAKKTQTAPAKKATPIQSAGKEEPAEKPLAKKTPAKKTPAKKAPAKKAPAKKTPAKKTPAKKAPAKKTPAKKVGAAKAAAAPTKAAPAKKAAKKLKAQPPRNVAGTTASGVDKAVPNRADSGGRTKKSTPKPKKASGSSKASANPNR